MNRNKLKYQEKTCVCNENEKKQTVSIAGCSDDQTAVAALPDDWIPRNSGPTLINYLKNREKHHDDVLKDLTEEARKVNKAIDDKVRNVAEILLSDIRQNDADIEAVIKDFQTNNVSLVDSRDKALNQIIKLSTQRIDDLVRFKQESLALERSRADGLRNVLKCHFQRLISVGHKPPKDLLHSFDELIYDINHQLISNSRAYVELEAQLRLQLDKRIIQARSVLNELCLNASQIDINRSFARKKYSQSVTNEESQNLKDGPKSHNTELEDVKKRISTIVETYNVICSKVFKEFLNRLDNLNSNNNFSRNNSCSEGFNLDNVVDDALGFISKCVERNSFEYSSTINITNPYFLDLQNKLSSFIKRLYDTYLILSQLLIILNEHTNRSVLIQNFTLLGLQDFQTSQDAIELSNEINFNIALEQMRNAPDLDKVQQQFDIINNYISKKTENYYQQKEAENAKLEDFMKYPLIMSPLLQSEINCFLYKHPEVCIPTMDQLKTSSDPAVTTQEILPTLLPLVQTTLQTQLQEQEVSAFTNECLESLETVSSMISEVLNRNSQEWVNKKCSLVNMRSFLKLMSHSVRAERVQAAREIRSSELKYHDSRFNSHLNAIYNLTDRLPIEASEFMAIDAPDLYPFCKWINDIKSAINSLLIKESVDPESKRLKMSSYALRLLRHRQLFEESLVSAINDFKQDVERTIQRARISNVRFMSRVKLFYEGGRFAATEAIRSCNALVKAADALESCLQRTGEALHQRSVQLLSLADQQVLPLQRIVEDVYKHGAKGAFDRKKLPTK